MRFRITVVSMSKGPIPPAPRDIRVGERHTRGTVKARARLRDPRVVVEERKKENRDERERERESTRLELTRRGVKSALSSQFGKKNDFRDDLSMNSRRVGVPCLLKATRTTMTLSRLGPGR